MTNTDLTLTMNNLTEEELEEKAEELRDDLIEMKLQASRLHFKLDQYLDGEITVEDYQDWIDANATDMMALEL